MYLAFFYINLIYMQKKEYMCICSTRVALSGSAFYFLFCYKNTDQNQYSKNEADPTLKPSICHKKTINYFAYFSNGVIAGFKGISFQERLIKTHEYQLEAFFAFLILTLHNG